MEKEFNLSKKMMRFYDEHNFDYFLEEDVKEFIRLLKEKIVQVEEGIALIDPKAIDKLAGDLR